MRKTIFGLLLALCLVVGLLPATAMAAEGDVIATMKIGFTYLNLTGYDKPIYYKNETSEPTDLKGNKFTGMKQVVGDADNWNLKFEWKSGDKGPTITMDGFIYDQ